MDFDHVGLFTIDLSDGLVTPIPDRPFRLFRYLLINNEDCRSRTVFCVVLVGFRGFSDQQFPIGVRLLVVKRDLDGGRL